MAGLEVAALREELTRAIELRDQWADACGEKNEELLYLRSLTKKQAEVLEVQDGAIKRQVKELEEWRQQAKHWEDRYRHQRLIGGLEREKP
jgi:gas vesicle protein